MQASERRGSALPVWRGWVQHAATGESHYFDCLSDLLAFVETQTGQPGVGGDLRFTCRWRCVTTRNSNVRRAQVRRTSLTI